MQAEEMIVGLKAGKIAKRLGNDHHVLLVIPVIGELPENPHPAMRVSEAVDGDLLPWIELVTDAGITKFFNGFSDTDILADDWLLLERA